MALLPETKEIATLRHSDDIKYIDHTNFFTLHPLGIIFLVDLKNLRWILNFLIYLSN